jgi:hypothetical protein
LEVYGNLNMLYWNHFCFYYIKYTFKLNSSISSIHFYRHVACVRQFLQWILKMTKSCFKRRASHVPNALKTIDNQVKFLIYCF